MTIVSISIRNNIYQIACNDGEEDKVHHLAASLTERVNKLSSSHAKANDNLLLAIAALTIESELDELRKRKHQLPLNNNNDEEKKISQSDNTVSETLDAISEYVENLARKLNNM